MSLCILVVYRYCWIAFKFLYDFIVFAVNFIVIVIANILVIFMIVSPHVSIYTTWTTIMAAI